MTNLAALGRLSTRACNVLANAGCQTLADVAAMTSAAIAGLPGIGSKTFGEVAQALAAAGLGFAPECPHPDLEEEECGPRFWPLLWLATDSWPALRDTLGAINRGAGYPGVSEAAHTAFVDLGRQIVDERRGRSRRLRSVINRALAHLTPPASWTPAPSYLERRLCGQPVRSLEDAQALLALLIYYASEAPEPLDDRLDHAINHLSAFLRQYRYRMHKGRVRYANH